jgi:hypothetical protein
MKITVTRLEVAVVGERKRNHPGEIWQSTVQILRSHTTELGSATIGRETSGILRLNLIGVCRRGGDPVTNILRTEEGIKLPW